ncbi:hypothetical protein K469DRAFT_690303 [Zopfia rhizophila CBS 207.26]|uniref:Uncharacterized protein n=1 Tax=Zopfia rhizophila CBS 207.26 TaxID=1314779 RepID=A0A6A6DY50_9PEZI|nr:hypothetical protein K469DRAFT_690303 [Zopfia rhizophila CBS 207.26]
MTNTGNMDIFRGTMKMVIQKLASGHTELPATLDMRLLSDSFSKTAMSAQVLLMAAKCGHISVEKALWDAGADINGVSSNVYERCLTLAKALWMNNIRIAKYFLGRGDTLNAQAMKFAEGLKAEPTHSFILEETAKRCTRKSQP